MDDDFNKIDESAMEYVNTIFATCSFETAKKKIALKITELWNQENEFD